MPLEGLNHACGLYAIWSPSKPVAWLTVQALNAQQTRGQEGAGIATFDGDFHFKAGRGLVLQVFPRESSVRNLRGWAAIGHTRYSTTGHDKACNVQPVHAVGPAGKVYLGHNGNLLNAAPIREELEKDGVTFRTTTDSEVIAHLLVRAPGADWVSRLRYVMKRISGSYCLAILTSDSIFLARDPTGNRPLCIGKTNGYWAAASESGVFKNQPIEFFREVAPGEIVVFDRDGLSSYPSPSANGEIGLCAFEWIYFLRPDSVFGGVESARARYRSGYSLGEDPPLKADLVTGVPRSGFYAADGYSAASRIQLAHGIVANTGGRVFLHPLQAVREEQNEKKYSALQIIDGKRIVLIDDSIVRGNSNKRVLKMLKEAGAAEIHFGSTFPPIINPCNLGIDMATREELIAARYGSKEEAEKGLAALWGISSVRYLSVTDLVTALGLPEEMLCLHCVGGRCPVSLPPTLRKEQFEKKSSKAVT